MLLQPKEKLRVYPQVFLFMPWTGFEPEKARDAGKCAERTFSAEVDAVWLIVRGYNTSLLPGRKIMKPELQI